MKFTVFTCTTDKRNETVRDQCQTDQILLLYIYNVFGRHAIVLDAVIFTDGGQNVTGTVLYKQVYTKRIFSTGHTEGMFKVKTRLVPGVFGGEGLPYLHRQIHPFAVR